MCCVGRNTSSFVPHPKQAAGKTCWLHHVWRKSYAWRVRREQRTCQEQTPHRSLHGNLEYRMKKILLGDDFMYWAWKNFRTAPYFIMHAHLIYYSFYLLSLNTIDNSLGNWIYTSLIITYCTNKRGFFHGVSFRAVFPSLSPFSPLSIPHFSFKALLFSFFYVTCRVRTLNSLSSSSE